MLTPRGAGWQYYTVITTAGLKLSLHSIGVCEGGANVKVKHTETFESINLHQLCKRCLITRAQTRASYRETRVTIGAGNLTDHALTKTVTVATHMGNLIPLEAYPFLIVHGAGCVTCLQLSVYHASKA